MSVRRALAFLGAGMLSLPVLMAAPVEARRKYTFEFRPVLAKVAPESQIPVTTAPVDLDAVEATIASCNVDAVSKLPTAPTTRLAAAAPDECVIFPWRTGGRGADRYYLGPASIAAVRGIDDAKIEFQPGQGWTVKVEFDNAGSKAWDRLARRQFHKQLAMTLEGYVFSAPTIEPNNQRFSSFKGIAVVSGDMKEKEAVAVAAAVRAASGR